MPIQYISLPYEEANFCVISDSGDTIAYGKNRKIFLCNKNGEQIGKTITLTKNIICCMFINDNELLICCKGQIVIYSMLTAESSIIEVDKKIMPMVIDKSDDGEVLIIGARSERKNDFYSPMLILSLEKKEVIAHTLVENMMFFSCYWDRINKRFLMLGNYVRQISEYDWDSAIKCYEFDSQSKKAKIVREYDENSMLFSYSASNPQFFADNKIVCHDLNSNLFYQVDISDLQTIIEGREVPLVDGGEIFNWKYNHITCKLFFSVNRIGILNESIFDLHIFDWKTSGDINLGVFNGNVRFLQCSKNGEVLATVTDEEVIVFDKKF